jgi:uncharacterized repeat protein (TIGR01451 family)
MARPRAPLATWSSAVVSRLAVALLVILCWTGSASAGSAVTIDGNLQDMIDYAGTVSNPGDGCAAVAQDPAKDVQIFDPKIVPCVPVVDNYYANGFDQILDVLAYDRNVKTLYLGLRVAGAIGDIDGNGDPNSTCAGSTLLEQVGIGFDEDYLWEINTDCAGGPEIVVELRDNTYTVTGAAFTSKSYAYDGSDLEIAIEGLELPFAYTVRVFCGNILDGLGEDTHRIDCLPPGPQFALDKTANPERICPNSNTTFTIVLTNLGRVPLLEVNLVDDLPAALSYVEGSSNSDCGVGQPSLDGSQLQWPVFSIAVGATCTIRYQARASEQCLGPQLNVATATASFTTACFLNGEPQTVQDSDDATVTCAAGGLCVEATLECDPAAACPGSPVSLNGTAKNCSADPETIVVTVAGSTFTFADLAAGATATFTANATMPECTDGAAVPFTASAVASNSCGESADEASCSVECRGPQIDVENAAEVQAGDNLHYTITLTNPSKIVTLETIELCADLCAGGTFVGNANPAPASQPAVGAAGGTICWNVASLAPGASMTFTYEVQAAGGGEQCTGDFTCHNVARAHGSCGAARADDEDAVDTVIPCGHRACRLTGGGTLNENGGNRGHKQHSFGGNVSPCPTGDGTTGDSWQHIERDGNKILFNFHSWEPCITECSIVPPGPCSPHGTITRAGWSGPGRYSLGAGSRENDAYFEAVVIDHNEGSCNRGQRDEYGITVWDAQTNQIVFEFPLQETETGNLQIHETPRRLFAAPAVAPAPTVGELSELAGLGHPYPNPFGASMSFGYEVPSGEAQDVEIGIYNVAGRLITRLASEVQSPGRYTVTWDGRDASGVQMAPGVYFLKSRVGSAEAVRRLLKVGP